MHVFVDNGTGKNRQLLDLTACAPSQSQKQALLGMHAFSGNDFISLSYEKEKPAFWKLVKNFAPIWQQESGDKPHKASSM